VADDRCKRWRSSGCSFYRRLGREEWTAGLRWVKHSGGDATTRREERGSAVRVHEHNLAGRNSAKSTGGSNGEERREDDGRREIHRCCVLAGVGGGRTDGRGLSNGHGEGSGWQAGPSCQRERVSERERASRWGQAGSERKGAWAHAGLAHGDSPKMWRGEGVRAHAGKG
jgi:hypothetical protein